MVEAPKISSLAGELLKFSVLSAGFLAVVLGVIFFFFADFNVYLSAGLSMLVAMGWSLLILVWVKTKLEELLGRLVYVIEVLEEKPYEKAVIPIPLYEELLEIVSSIKELVNSFEDRYRKEINSLNEQIESISESTSKILSSLEKFQEGYLDVEFPKGLDPVGAVGQAMEIALKEYRKVFTNIKREMEICSRELDKISDLLAQKGDKIEIETSLKRLRMAEEEIKRNLEFIKV